MNITSSTAAPGGQMSIAIRGGLSGQQPLVVIDGVPQALIPKCLPEQFTPVRPKTIQV